jgi:hypothetical protein
MNLSQFRQYQETQHTFNLKGDRKYVHGTDIIDFIMGLLKENIDEIDQFDISFPQVITNQDCQFMLSKCENDINIKSPKCKGKFEFSGDFFYFGLTEQTRHSVANIGSYDENAIVMHSILTEQGAILLPNTGYSFIESLVALTKQYHNKYQSLSDKKWLFGRLKLSRFTHDVQQIEITLQSAITNKLTRSKILVNEQEVGEIYFTASK